MEKESEIVFPGDFLATAEEFISGYGVYEEEGNLYSAIMGRVVRDTERMMVKIVPVTSTPLFLRVGQKVVGRVTDVKSSMASLEILKVVGKEREISGERKGIVHISKISEGYVPSIRDAIRINDFVRARVLMARPAVRLTMAGPDLGVILARCPECGVVLQRKAQNMLICPSCEATFRRKLASDYGSGNVRSRKI
ncbi:MAG: exosome complex RNA-binding protein Csl4 [Thermoplasmata archaeon]|nr:exosome complex RNA-binding protein Csl4 [Thermoplasmata archaeon]OYT49774.1 MAG: RNA-binding protein [Thermoplasmatales archaeon ex4484_36]RLF73083.1 MAG: RNA-binding protein [Thermoplasmata archaeon]RLF75511.1 MAG: RNA-binding protein [Thermoplasmata archaeon]HDD59451.1 RNA-binding protein [Euryarchaeota archaeon]